MSTRSPKAPPQKDPFWYPDAARTCPPNGKWVMCIPVVSNKHITLADHDILENIVNAPPDTGVRADLVFCGCSGGWIINLGAVEVSRLHDTGFSDAFISLLVEFHELGFKHLRLDKDGDEFNLPTFEW